MNMMVIQIWSKKEKKIAYSAIEICHLLFIHAGKGKNHGDITMQMNELISIVLGLGIKSTITHFPYTG